MDFALTSFFHLDILGSILGDSKPVLSVTDLHQRICEDVQRTEQGRNTTPYLRHGRPSISQFGGRRRESEYSCDVSCRIEF